MSPATPGPLTVLLVPPPGDTALLAEEAGGRVPTVERCSCGAWYFPTIFGSRRKHEGHRVDDGQGDLQALPLVRDGVPVEMSCDRAVRLIRGGVNEDGRPVLRDVYTVEQALGIARVFADLFVGARVVLLRDGREVTE